MREKKSDAEFEKRLQEQKFLRRFLLVKAGKDALREGRPSDASYSYKQYLNNLCIRYGLKLETLAPKALPESVKNSEKLIIAQVAYDLARISDLSKHEDSKKMLQTYLTIFTRFTINQSYQAMNTQILRKNLKKSRFNNRAAFEEAMTRIKKDSKLCFLATYALNGEEEKLKNFRSFKLKLLEKNLGEKFVTLYYSYGQNISSFLIKNPVIGKPLKLILLAPMLNLIHWFIKR
jgi:hypothetical protein